jgi:exodeoxyribonuclease-3
MKIATWNINSLRLRVNHIKNIDADILCLQEMKCQNDQLPANEIKKLGYEHHYARGEKAYNGVGIFSKVPLADIETLDFGGNSQARHISAALPDGTRIHNFYVPAGRDIPDPVANPHFAHKLQFADDMSSYFKTLKDTQKHIIVGDFNIAPFEHDVWSHKQMLNVISHTPVEIEKMEKMYKTLGWVDTARHFVPHSEKCYSWWSYRNQDWKKSNRGRRLDHIWVTKPLQEKLKSHYIIRDARDWEKPSDHVPLISEIDL